MAKNRDGLEPGEPVDFTTWQRTELQRRQRKTQDPEPPKPRRKPRAETQ